MTYILIRGQTNTGKTSTGKTSSCRRLRGLLDQDPTYTKHATPQIPRTLKHDFIEHYEKNGIHIVLSSQSDYDRSMERLAWYIDRLTATGIYPSLIITSIRETDEQKDQASRMLALLDEMAAREPNGTATVATGFESFYNTKVRTKPIHTPYAAAVMQQAVVLHLRRKPNATDSALAQYWDDTAAAAKRALDAAVARRTAAGK